MKVAHLVEICRILELGSPIAVPTRVYGGLLHLMWRVETDKARYAIKELSRDIDLGNEVVRKNYELSERIAFRFSEKGVGAVSALDKGGKHLVEIDGVGFLVFPWVDAQVLGEDAITEFHALKIAEVLARMHLINLEVPEIVDAQFDVHANDSLCQLFSKAEVYDCSFVEELRKYQDDILAINDAYRDVIGLLKIHVVVSHGDLDPKNVLWDVDNNPVLIDWESARKLNPTYEIVNASLDWSGITTGMFDEKQFVKMIYAYMDAGGILDYGLLEVDFYGVLGNWINWMVYNINRSCVIGESDQKKLGVKQVNQVLSTIIGLKNRIPALMRAIRLLS